MFVYNSASYLYRFRLGLMLAMKERGWEVVAVSPFGAAAKKIEARGIRFHKLPLKRKGINPFADLRTFFYLAKLYKQERPNIVHHFTVKPVIYGTAAAHLTRVSGIVNLIPGLGYVFLKGGLLQTVVEKMYRLVLTSRVRVIFQNRDDLSYFLKRQLVIQGQTFVIYGSGVDTDLFSPQRFPLKPHSSSVTFVLVARMLWDKGIAEYVQAARLVKEEIPSAHFILLGSPDQGNPASIPVSWLEEQHRLGRVEWMRHIEDVRPILAGADVIVLPSYREGASRALMEAAAMAKPIVTTDVPGCREIVEGNQNGLLVPSKNVEFLAQALLELAVDPDRRIRMGEASRERALKYFDEHVIIRQILEVYSCLDSI